MSLILDALNKADNERNKEQTPTINSSHDDSMPFENSPKRQNTLLVIGLVVCVVLIAVLAYFLFFSKDSGTKAVNAEKNRLVNAAPATQQEIARQQQRERNAPQEESAEGKVVEAQSISLNDIKPSTAKTAKPTAPTNRVDEHRKKMIAAQYEQVNRKSQKAAPSTETRTQPDTVKATPSAQTRNAGPKPAQPTAQDDRVAAIYKNQTQPTPKPQVTAKQPKASSQPVATPPPPALNKLMLSGHPDIGAVNSLPFATQKELPTIMYREHHYPNTVVMNKKTLRKGQMVEANLYVEEILQDGVIMRYKTFKFKMPRLNSWVNM